MECFAKALAFKQHTSADYVANYHYKASCNDYVLCSCFKANVNDEIMYIAKITFAVTRAN
jgi:hypothetical protein